MRTKKELGELMLDYSNSLKTCLCRFVFNIHYSDIINAKEFDFLLYLIEKNKPKKMYNCIFYWKPGEIKPRIQWINEHLINATD